MPIADEPEAPITLKTMLHADPPECRGSSGKSPLRSNREHYLRLRKLQFIGSRNLYDFCRQPYAVWLRHGPPLKTVLRPPLGAMATNGERAAVLVCRLAGRPISNKRSS